uniref:Uncharacterized protein n=1 Tax=Romanomermis culicivorax TaxID=13658 RepID=A0A915KW92_ROMCU
MKGKKQLMLVQQLTIVVVWMIETLACQIIMPIQMAIVQRMSPYKSIYSSHTFSQKQGMKLIDRLNKIFEPQSQPQTYRSLSIAHLERYSSSGIKPSTPQMSISQSSTEISDRKDKFSSNNPYHLDFKSTESVNKWYNYILNELDSVSTLSSARIRNDNSSDKSSSKTIAGDSAFGSSLNFSCGENLSPADSFYALSVKNRNYCPKLDAQFSRACSELRNIGSGFDLNGENCVKSVKYKSTLNIPLVIDENLSRKSGLDQTIERKSSFTWPIEQCSDGVDSGFNAKCSTVASISSPTSSMFHFAAEMSRSLNKIFSSSEGSAPIDGVEYYWQKVDDVLISRPMRPGKPENETSEKIILVCCCPVDLT